MRSEMLNPDLNASITYHLPTEESSGGLAQTQRLTGTASLSFPMPEAGWLGDLACYLRAGWSAATSRPITEILRVLDSLNARWEDSTSRERRQADALLCAVTAYPATVVTPALDH